MMALAKQFTNGRMGLIALWVLGHKLLTGKWPWDDAKARFLKWPIPERLRHTPAVEAVYGKNDHTAYVGLGYFNAIGFRGASDLGIRGAFDAKKGGATGWQAAEAAEASAFNGAVHPYVSGPFAGAAIQSVFLREPFLSGQRDPITGRPEMQFKPVVGRVGTGPLSMLGAHASAGLFGLNSSAASVLGAAGYGPDAYDMSRLSPEGRLLKMVTDIGTPRAIAGAPDVAGAYDRYAKEARAAGTQDLDLDKTLADQLRQKDIYAGGLEPGDGETDKQYRDRKALVERVMNRALVNVLANTRGMPPNQQRKAAQEAIRSIKADAKYQQSYGTYQAQQQRRQSVVGN